ncbi:haloacid dehalogenase type II [Halobacteriaceae archaeon GCM10025711]
MDRDALCFDMYGTLCDTSSVTGRLGEVLDVPDRVAADVDGLWRRKQLQYSYQRGQMDDYAPFWEVTGDALDYALAFYGFDVDERSRDRIRDAYNHLDPFPDAVEALERLGEAGYAVTVLSNGNPEMLATLAENAGLASHLDDVISADEVSTFKPAPAVYENAARRLDRSWRRACSSRRTPGTSPVRRAPGWGRRG